jgi:hypothetical protein
VISHALTIRTMQRQELLVAAERAQLMDQYCPPAPFGDGSLFLRCKQWLHRTMAETRSPRTVLRVATQG